MVPHLSYKTPPQRDELMVCMKEPLLGNSMSEKRIQGVSGWLQSMWQRGEDTAFEVKMLLIKIQAILLTT